MEQIIEQRSEEWRKQRLGRFSASEIYKLMGKASLGETGKSYAIDKAIEQLYGEVDENFVSYDMERGIELEPLAFAKFKELMSLRFIEVENCGFFNLLNDAGASPDGLVGNKAVLEIKLQASSLLVMPLYSFHFCSISIQILSCCHLAPSTNPSLCFAHKYWSEPYRITAASLSVSFFMI